MEKILYTDFEGVDDILAKFLKDDAMLQKAMKRSNISKFWKKVVGKPFDEKSKPFGMIGAHTMIIACESAVVVQELTLRKKQLLKNYAPYVKPLNINLTDMVFDVKKWTPPGK